MAPRIVALVISGAAAFIYGFVVGSLLAQHLFLLLIAIAVGGGFIGWAGQFTASYWD